MLSLLFLAGLLLSGCELFHEESDGLVQVRTDKDAYVFDSTMVVHLKMMNGRATRLYYTCNISIIMEEWSGDQKTGEWYVVLPLECGATGIVAPKSIVTEEIPLEQELSWIMRRSDTIRLDRSVRYRFRPVVYLDNKTSARRPLDYEELRSNAVTIIRKQ